MVMMAEPVLKAVEATLKKITNYQLLITKKNTRRALKNTATCESADSKLGNSAESKILIINFVPSAEKFTTEVAKKISKKYTDIILICGRYEGIDARVEKVLRDMKYTVIDLSVGDYVLTGGEIPAMILIDSLSRQIKGVLGNFDSCEEERVSSSEIYTRPEVLIWPSSSKTQAGPRKEYKVPKVLLSGNHKDIENWKRGIK